MLTQKTKKADPTPLDHATTTYVKNPLSQRGGGV